jgi:hypothetical protein
MLSLHANYLSGQPVLYTRIDQPITPQQFADFVRQITVIQALSARPARRFQRA